MYLKAVVTGRGAKGVMCPRRHCARGGIWRGENMECWNLAASGELEFTLQTVIFLYPLILCQFWDHTPTVSAPRPHIKQAVCTLRNLLLTWLIIHLL